MLEQGECSYYAGILSDFVDYLGEAAKREGFRSKDLAFSVALEDALLLSLTLALHAQGLVTDRPDHAIGWLQV